MTARLRQAPAMHEPKLGPVAALYTLIASVAFQALSGIGGGIALVVDPSGAFLGLPTGLLDGSPFNDYRVPGLILLLLLGVFPAVVSFALWRRRRWSWPGALLTGTALVIWIVVEVILIGYQARPPLQLIYGLLGILILGLALVPGVRSALEPAGVPPRD